jgi:inhibitor of KinA sporulation pathway (predicted exonuclease)
MSDSLLNSSDLQKITNEPVNSVGVVLQRGGEELILEKVLYRFTIRLAAEFPREQLSNIAWGVWQRTIPKTQLEFFTVKPEQLETAMSQARDDKNVAFASHFYKFKKNPRTYVYLSDKITT